MADRVGDYSQESGSLPAGSIPVATSISGGTIYQTPSGQQIEVAASSQGIPLNYTPVPKSAGVINRGIGVPQREIKGEELRLNTDRIVDVRTAPSLILNKVDSNVKKLIINGSGSKVALVSEQEKINRIVSAQNTLKQEALNYSQKVNQLKAEQSNLEKDVLSFQQYLAEKNRNNIPYTAGDVTLSNELNQRIESINQQAQLLNSQATRLQNLQSAVQTQSKEIQKQAQGTPVASTIGITGYSATINQLPSGKQVVSSPIATSISGDTIEFKSMVPSLKNPVKEVAVPKRNVSSKEIISFNEFGFGKNRNPKGMENVKPYETTTKEYIDDVKEMLPIYNKNFIPFESISSTKKTAPLEIKIGGGPIPITPNKNIKNTPDQNIISFSKQDVRDFLNLIPFKPSEAFQGQNELPLALRNINTFKPTLSQANFVAGKIEEGIYGIGSELIQPIAVNISGGIFRFGREFNQAFPGIVPEKVRESNIKNVKALQQLFNPENKSVDEVSKKFAGTAFEYGTYLIPGNFATARGIQSAFLEKDPDKVLGNLAEASVLATLTISGTVAASAATNAFSQAFPTSKVAQTLVGAERAVQSAAFTKVLPTVALGYLGYNAFQSFSLTPEQKASQLGKQGAFALGYKIVGAAPKLIKASSFYIGNKFIVPQEKVFDEAALEGIGEYVTSNKSGAEALQEFRESKPPQEVLELFPEYQQRNASLEAQTPSIKNLLINAERYVELEDPKAFNEFARSTGVQEDFIAQGGYQFDTRTGSSRIVFPTGQEITNTELIHELGHKLIRENPLYSPIDTKDQSNIERLFLDFRKLASNKPGLLGDEVINAGSYPEEDQFEEFLVRFASNFPEEIVKPTTETGKLLNKIYEPFLTREIGNQELKELFIGTHVTPNIFPSRVEITPGTSRGLESFGLSESTASRASPHFAEIGRQPKYSLFGEFDLSSIFGSTPAVQYIQQKGFERLPEDIRTDSKAAKQFLDVFLPESGEQGTAYLTAQYERSALGLAGGKSEIEVKLPITPARIGLTRVQPESLINRIFGGFSGYTKLDYTNARGINVKGNVALVPTIAVVNAPAETPQQVFFETITNAFSGYTSLGSEFKENKPVSLFLLPAPYSAPSKSSEPSIKQVSSSFSFPSYNFEKVSGLSSLPSIKRSSGGGSVPYEPPIIPPYYPPIEEGDNSQGGGSEGGGSPPGDSGGGSDTGSPPGSPPGSPGSPPGSFGSPFPTNSPSGGSSGGFPPYTTPYVSNYTVENVYYPKKKLKVFTPAFDVFVKKRILKRSKRGKKFVVSSEFVKVNKNPFLTYNEAVALGIARTDVPIQQSFEPRPNLRLTQANNFALPVAISKFYSSKKKPGVFIEKRKFAIDNPFEKQQLKTARRASSKPLTLSNRRLKPVSFAKSPFSIGKKIKFNKSIF